MRSSARCFKRFRSGGKAPRRSRASYGARARHFGSWRFLRVRPPSALTRRARFARVSTLIATLLASCGPPPHGPYFGDERLIVLGVSPDAEADELSRQLNARGLREARRIRGKTFTALGFGPSKDPLHQTDVRVITGRGIALALEARAATMLEPGERYALLSSPHLDTLDADRDLDELYVARTALPTGTRCLLVYQVRQTGIVEQVATDNYQLVRVPDADPAWREPFCAAPAAPAAPADAGSPAAQEAVITAPP
jgi:hypothetical protein